MTNQYSSYTVEEAGKKVLNNIIFICDIIVHVLQYLQTKKNNNLLLKYYHMLFI